MSRNLKSKLLELCLLELKNRSDQFKTALNDISISMENETKSSVGDKHETARARMQFEQGKLDQQLKEIKGQIADLQRIDTLAKHTAVRFGSLVDTDRANFFIAVAIGKIKMGDADFLVISPSSPIAKKLIGTKRKQIIEFNQQSYEIRDFT